MAREIIEEAAISTVSCGGGSRRTFLKTTLVGTVSALALFHGVASANEPIRVGMLMTYVGASALFAREQARGAEMRIAEVNVEGGIDGRPIELITYDTEGAPDRAGSLYRRLANEHGVPAVIGPDSAFVALGMQDIPREVAVMSVAGPGLYEMIRRENRDYMVGGWTAYSFVGTLAMAFHKERFGIERVGMITTADGVGERIARTAARVAAELGIDLTIESQPASDRDLLPSLRRLASASPAIDALYVFGSGPFANIAMNQSELAGLSVPIFYTGGNVIPTLIEGLSPEAAERVYFATAPSVVGDTLPDDDPFAPRIRDFYGKFQETYGEAPTFPATVGYDMAETVVDALRAVGTDREAIAEYIRNEQRFDGVQGVHFERTRGEGYGVRPEAMVVATIRDGKFVFVDYLKPYLENVGLTQDVVTRFMEEEDIYLN